MNGKKEKCEYLPLRLAKTNSKHSMQTYIESKEIIKNHLHMNFLGAFTMVAITNGVSDILHTDRDDGGLTWVLPIGEWEGGDLCIPQLGMRVELKAGDAITFHANFLAHFNSQLITGNRLVLTCFTDRNMLCNSMKHTK